MPIGGAAPAREPDPHPKSTKPRRSSGGSNTPTPLDTVFILFASMFLLLMLLWIASQLANRNLFAQLPGWTGFLNEIWTKVLLGTGAGGALALRKWMYKSRPSPNYLLWIPGFTIFFALALFLVKMLVPAQPVSTTHYHLPIRFSVQPLQADAQLSDSKMISFLTTLPTPASRPIYIPMDKPESAGLYSNEIDVPAGDGVFEAEINHAVLQSRLVNSAGHYYEYRLCVKNNPRKAFPDNFTAQPNSPVLKLSCSTTPDTGVTKCMSSDPTQGYLMSCDDTLAKRGGIIPFAYADVPPVQGRESGWVVPSLDTLSKMTDRERVGYTRFDVSFTPSGAAASADHYYFILRVNEKPIFIDGFPPEKMSYGLQPGSNVLSFGLENLNFTGQYEGYEKLALRIVFLKGDATLYQQDLQRDYIALRNAPEVASDTAVGTFRWTGTYVPPKNENKYEILLASANCGNPVQRECIDRTMRAKTRFDQGGLRYNSEQVVMVVRPPLRIPPSYGLALGVVQPTSQVQFTFNADEAAQLCHWAKGQIGSSAAGNLIQANLTRYEVATRGYASCN